jgi:DNA-binding transcriptional ArsR family regulator
LSYARFVTERILELDDIASVVALMHPVRLRVLEALRAPDSAAGLARTTGESRQNVNYHLNALERGGLVRAVGERRKGNMVERLYEAVAGSFVVSPHIAWGGGRRAAALRDQISLAALVELGRRLQRDAGVLLDRAAFDGDEITSASIAADVTFADAQVRSAFMEEYLSTLGRLLKKYGADQGSGQAFRVVFAAYPNTDEETV